MANLKTVLRRYGQFTPAPSLGSGSPTHRAKQDMLARDLLRVSQVNYTYFGLCFAAVLGVLIGCAAIALRYLDSPETIRVIFAVLGISVTGLITQMINLWKQKVLADTMLVLARNLDDTQTKAVVDTILAKF